MKYFEGLTQEIEIKARYKQLAKQYHPDLGGDTAIMQQINTQYEQVLQGAYQKAGKSITEIDELLKNDMQAATALQMIIGLTNISVELCGNWIWITGDTRPVKDLLKKANFFWATKKEAWYWRPPEQKFSRKGGTRDLAWIRANHGTSSLNKESNKKTLTH